MGSYITHDVFKLPFKLLIHIYSNSGAVFQTFRLSVFSLFLDTGVYLDL